MKTSPAGEQIFLRDVADVALGSKSYGVASAFGEEPATLLVIYQEPGSNAVDVGNRVKAAIGRLSERFPDGVSCTTIVDSTESIRSGVEEIILTLILALVLVIAIIYLFIQDWRATLIPLVAHSGLAHRHVHLLPAVGLLDQHHLAVRAGIGDRTGGRRCDRGGRSRAGQHRTLA